MLCSRRLVCWSLITYITSLYKLFKNQCALWYFAMYTHPSKCMEAAVSRANPRSPWACGHVLRFPDDVSASLAWKRAAKWKRTHFSPPHFIFHFTSTTTPIFFSVQREKEAEEESCWTEIGALCQSAGWTSIGSEFKSQELLILYILPELAALCVAHLLSKQLLCDPINVQLLLSCCKGSQCLGSG